MCDILSCSNLQMAAQDKWLHMKNILQNFSIFISLSTCPLKTQRLEKWMQLFLQPFHILFCRSLDIPTLESTDESPWIAFDSTLGWTPSSLVMCFSGIHTLGLDECMVNVFKPQITWDWGYYNRYGLKQTKTSKTPLASSCNRVEVIIEYTDTIQWWS